MKVYDCFTFFNELELLELRLNELNNVVDFFVIVESNKTFTYNEKPLFYLENKDLFKDFSHKIIHIIVEDMPFEDNCWGNEFHQRNAILRGLNCNDEDLVIVSDVDEIPRPEEIRKIKENFSEKIYCFVQNLYFYYFNVFYIDYWRGSKMCSYNALKGLGPQNLRMYEHPSNINIENGGWHFSYLGGAEKIKYKIESFAHYEVNTDEVKNNIVENILTLNSLYNKNTTYKVVEIDCSYPRYLLDNLEKYKNYIYEIK